MHSTYLLLKNINIYSLLIMFPQRLQPIHQACVLIDKMMKLHLLFFKIPFICIFSGMCILTAPVIQSSLEKRELKVQGLSESS